MLNTLFTVLIILLSVFTGHAKSEASEAGSFFSGAVSGEAWYANWKSESGMDQLGVKLEYDIEPSIIWGYSTAVGFNKNGKLLSGLILDYFTTRIEQNYNDQALDNNTDDDLSTYKMIKVKFDQRLGGWGYFHMSLMQAEFEGKLTLSQGDQYFESTNGTIWDMESNWFKADAIYLIGGKKMMSGIGYRYFSFNKPQAITEFYGTEKEDKDSSFGSMVQADELISGKIADTEIEGHLLLIGIWDTSYMGFPSDSLFFYDGLFYIGSADVKSDDYEAKGRLALGCELSLGLKYSFKFSETSGISMRLGYRYLQHSVTYAEETGEDENGIIWKGSYIVEEWHGPFFGLSWYF